MDKDLLLKRSYTALIHCRNVVNELSEGNATEQLDADIEAILKGQKPQSQQDMETVMEWIKHPEKFE